MDLKRSLFWVLLIVANNGYAQTSTFNDVAPILYKNCTNCHRPGGGAPFSMLSFNAISPWTTSMVHALQHGEMPPWGADTSYMHFVNERPITQSDKSALLNWIYDGALEGNPALLPPAPTYPMYQLKGVPDTVIQMTLFKSNAAYDDAYNTLVVPLNLGQIRYIRALEIVPSDPSLIHHSVVTADTLGQITVDTSGSALSISGDIGIGTWAPGSMPIVYPNDPELKMGIELPASGEIAMNIHTPKGTSGQWIDIKIRLYLYPENEVGIRPVYDFVPLQYWSNNFRILAGQIKTFSVEEDAPQQPISIFSAFPHSHQICTEILNYAYQPQTNDTIPLIKIDRWDFEHQEYYYFKNLVKIPPSYKFHADHTYDNTSLNHHNPFSPPQLITVGFATDDEMLFDGFQYIDYQIGDELIDIDSILKSDPLINYLSVEERSPQYVTTSLVMPNPVEQKATINFYPPLVNQESHVLRLFNSRGEQIQIDYHHLNGAIEISRSTISSGVYFYEVVTDKDVRIVSGRIVFS